MSNSQTQLLPQDGEARYGIDWKVIRSLACVVSALTAALILAPILFSTERKPLDIEAGQVAQEVIPTTKPVALTKAHEAAVALKSQFDHSAPSSDTATNNSNAAEHATPQTETANSVVEVASLPVLAPQPIAATTDVDSDLGDESTDDVPASNERPHGDIVASSFAYSRELAPLSENTLIATLQSKVKDVGLDVDTKLLAKRRQSFRHQPSQSKSVAVIAAELSKLVSQRPDLRGLPFRKAGECQSDRKTAQVATNISLDFQRTRRRFLASRRSFSSSGSSSFAFNDAASFSEDDAKYHWIQYFDLHQHGRETVQIARSIPTLVQMLQVGEQRMRHELVAKIATVEHPVATTILAQRAMFDASMDVRQASVKALEERPAKEYRQTLLEGLQYPWPPIADHAAEALVALEDVDAVNDLVPLLSKPDPQAPFQNEDNQWVVREVVRVNHLRNCLLCHPRSQSRRDLVRGFVPVPGSPIPVAYYHSQRGIFVRADITYLKQDFSLKHEVKKHGVWPKWQRFDYMVRTRQLAPNEVSRWKAKQFETSTATRSQQDTETAADSYPQRDAVAWALSKLTGNRAQHSLDE